MIMLIGSINSRPKKLKNNKLLSLIVLLVLCGCTKDRFYSLAQYVDDACSKTLTCEVQLSDIYKKDWDYAYYFVSGATLKGVQSEGIEVDADFEFDELCSHLLFVKKNRIVDSDIDCTVSNEDNLDFFRRGRLVYTKAIVQVDRQNQDFLKIPHKKSSFKIEKEGDDGKGRIIYVGRIAP